MMDKEKFDEEVGNFFLHFQITKERLIVFLH